MKTIRIISLLWVMAACSCVASPKQQLSAPADSAALPADSVKAILLKAGNGDATAQNLVGQWCYEGTCGQQKDYRQALQWWTKAAQQDHADAIANMAKCYQLGHGTDRDSTMAIGLYQAAVKKGCTTVIPQHEAMAAKTGNAFSCMLLFDCYQRAIGVKRDQAKAQKYLAMTAEKGNATAQYQLALIYLNSQQADKAAQWMRKAAEADITGAKFYYGRMLLQGNGVVQDKQRGIAFLQQAADEHFMAAHAELARIYYEGNGVTADAERALPYIAAAVEGGDMESTWYLGLCFLNGTGIERDYYKAVQWLALTASSSHRDDMKRIFAENRDNSFGHYLQGLIDYYINKDYKSAISHFEKVKKADSAEGLSMLGICQGTCDNDRRNEKKAVKTLRKAVEAGSASAKYYLAMMVETGSGTKQDDGQAVQLLREAAHEGIAYAQCKLGDRYMTGRGVSRDLTEAARLYLQAEYQRHLTPESAKNLAECYRQKVAVLRDLAQAEQRIARLNQQKNNGSLIAMLQMLK